MIRNAMIAGFLLAVGIAYAGAAPPERQALTGGWGGLHIGPTLTAEGGQVEYDCAHGTIDGPIVPDRAGRFEATGTHTAEHGGPAREGEEGTGRPAVRAGGGVIGWAEGGYRCQAKWATTRACARRGWLRSRRVS